MYVCWNRIPKSVSGICLIEDTLPEKFGKKIILELRESSPLSTVHFYYVFNKKILPVAAYRLERPYKKCVEQFYFRTLVSENCEGS